MSTVEETVAAKPCVITFRKAELIPKHAAGVQHVTGTLLKLAASCGGDLLGQQLVFIKDIFATVR
eukprot:6458717-Pyramimonas_sp.AAC.1